MISARWPVIGVVSLLVVLALVSWELPPPGANFNQELVKILLDKGLLALVLAVAGYWLNRMLEQSKARQALENELAKLKDTKRLDFLERQLAEFYWPLYLRLEIDNAIWRRILDRNSVESELRQRLGAAIEKDVILPNHEQVVSLLQAKFHLAQANPEMVQAIFRYLRHVAVYRALRGEKCYDKNPIDLGEPWPGNLFHLVRGKLDQLQAQYDARTAARGADTAGTLGGGGPRAPEAGFPLGPGDPIAGLRQLAEEYLRISSTSVPDYGDRVRQKNELAERIADYARNRKIPRDRLAELARREGNEGIMVGLAHLVEAAPEKADPDLLLMLPEVVRSGHARYRIVMAFSQLLQRRLAGPEHRDRILHVLCQYDQGDDEFITRRIAETRKLAEASTTEAVPLRRDE
jgi:hypothetical protein